MQRQYYFYNCEKTYLFITEIFIIKNDVKNLKMIFLLYFLLHKYCIYRKDPQVGIQYIY